MSRNGTGESRLTLLTRREALASPLAQLRILDTEPPFLQYLGSTAELRAKSIEILQVNVGKVCNMTCHHCHVDAGPDRRELMDHATAAACVDVLRSHPEISTFDITGGAPEMNPEFEFLVEKGRELQRHVIDRSNLTILTINRFRHLPEFLAAHQVEVVASLPCYLQENTDQQRGNGTFAQSMAALRRLNDLGYGTTDPDLQLTLVYNPVGFSLPPNQEQLEADYRRVLREQHAVEFSRLITITNLPISRFLESLIRDAKFEEYMQRLRDAFNPDTIDGLMCRNTLSVGWDGKLYDCDFNQMLELPMAEHDARRTIHNFDHAILSRRAIHTRSHCFGCTAGAGSGCQGAITAST